MENNTHNFSERKVKRLNKKIAFWKRQFQTEATNKQKIFDIVFGVILPVVCCYFDPIVFKGGVWGLGDPFLADFRAFAYILSFTSIMALLGFILCGEKFKWFNGFLSGLFGIGAVISLLIGIIIFPVSLFGLLILIGALGFTPFLAAFVYLRNSVRAFELAQPIFKQSFLIRSVVLSAVLSLVIPYLANVKIQNALEIMLEGDANTVQTMGYKFKYIAPLVNTNALVLQYRKERRYKDEKIIYGEKGKAIAELYKDLSGEDIEREERVVYD